MSFHAKPLSLGNVQVGEAWVGESIVAPEGFALDKQPDSLLADRTRARRNTEPIFTRVRNPRSQITVLIDSLHGQTAQIMDAFTRYRLNYHRALLDTTATEDPWAQVTADSVHYAQLRDNARVRLRPEQWRILGNDMVARDSSMLAARDTVLTDPPILDVILDRLEVRATTFATAGILDVPMDTVFSGFIKVRDTDANTFERVSRSDVFGRDQVDEHLEQDLAAMYPNLPVAGMAASFLRAVFVPSHRYDHLATERARDLAELQVSPTLGMVAKDDIIVRRGEVITPDVLQRLESFERLLAEEGAGPAVFSLRSLGKLVLALCVFGFLFGYLYAARRNILFDNQKLLLITLLLTVMVGLFAIVVRSDMDFMFAVPTLMVCVVLTLVFDSHVGLVGTLVLALLGGYIAGAEQSRFFFLATTAGGALAVFTIQGARNRSQFFISAVAALAGYVVVCLGLWLFQSSAGIPTQPLLMAGINSFLLIAAYPLLWIVERAFNVASDLRLMELGDFNHPLLKRLQQEAIGTFNHTVQVANMAETAAETIGANSLLIRVGAFYHDIGKLAQPEYFVENQRSGINPHDDLAPDESARIIINHVAYGMTLAQDYRLPNVISDFIPTHHGTTRTEFFYHRAVQQAEDGESVDEKEFRYVGPRPRSKEEAILMLTDGVEAACKSIAEPSEEKLGKRIDAIFDARIEDGQLDHSQLTIRDLSDIKEAFLRQLVAFYHVRVEYPEREKAA